MNWDRIFGKYTIRALNYQAEQPIPGDWISPLCLKCSARWTVIASIASTTGFHFTVYSCDDHYVELSQEFLDLAKEAI